MPTLELAPAITVQCDRCGLDVIAEGVRVTIPAARTFQRGYDHERGVAFVTELPPRAAHEMWRCKSCAIPVAECRDCGEKVYQAEINGRLAHSWGSGYLCSACGRAHDRDANDY